MELDVVKNNEQALKMYQDFGFEIAEVNTIWMTKKDAHGAT